MTFRAVAAIGRGIMFYFPIHIIHFTGSSGIYTNTESGWRYFVDLLNSTFFLNRMTNDASLVAFSRPFSAHGICSPRSFPTRIRFKMVENDILSTIINSARLFPLPVSSHSPSSSLEVINFEIPVARPRDSSEPIPPEKRQVTLRGVGMLQVFGRCNTHTQEQND